MNINKNLSVSALWRMVNRIEANASAKTIRERCLIAENWIRENDTITNDEFDDLMMAVSYIYRDSYH